MTANEILNTFKCYKQMVKMSGFSGFSWLIVLSCKTYILPNDDVFTKFGLILSICSQDIEQKPDIGLNQSP